jgi:hypothetical protein
MCATCQLRFRDGCSKRSENRKRAHVSAEQGSDHCSASEPLSPDLSATADDECFRTGSVRPRLAPERPGEVVEMDDLFSTTDALAKKSSFT